MKEDTKLAHAGRDPHAHHGAVNTPVYHASTILFKTMDAFVNRSSPEVKIKYGLRGTPTSFALEDALTALEQGHGTVLAPSGLQAITMALMAFLKSGDHVLVTDSTYAPCRNFCNKVLKDYGIETDYYDPSIGAGIAKLIKPQHPDHLDRGAGQPDLRDAGHSGDLEGRTRRRRDRHDR